jgi:hypothetical protein
VDDRNWKVPENMRQETAVAYHARPTKPLVVFQDALFLAQLHGPVLSLERRSDGASWTVCQGHAAAEARLCRVLDSTQVQFRVAAVRNGSLQIRSLTVDLDSGQPTRTRNFNFGNFGTDFVALPPPNGRGPWHVFGIAALPDLTLVHVSTSGRESLLVAQVGLRPPERAEFVFPALRLGVADSVLGVTNFGSDSLVVGLHRKGCEYLVRINNL